MLETIFGDMPEERYICIVTLPDAHSEWFTSPYEAYIYAVEQDELSKNVYCMCAYTRGKLNHRRQSASEVAGIMGFWADVDVSDGTPSKENYPETKEQAEERLKEAGIPDPTLTVDSGNGLHMWWLFKEPLEFDDVRTRGAVGHALRCFQEALRRATGGLDTTFDLARILRVAGTHNYKEEKTPLPVEVRQSDDNRRYLYDDLLTYCADLPYEEDKQPLDLQEIHAEEVSDDVFNNMLLDVDFLRTWKKDRSNDTFPSGSGSQSEYDMAISYFAAAEGLSEGQIIWLIHKHRHINGEKTKHSAYYIATARKGIESARKQRAESYLSEDRNTVSQSYDKDIIALRDILGINIKELHRYPDDDNSTFTLFMEEGRIHLGTINTIMSQALFRNKIASSDAKKIPNPVDKGKWFDVAQMLIDISIDMETTSDGDTRGAVHLYLGDYLAHRGVESDEERIVKALEREVPFYKKSECFISMNDFIKYANSRFKVRYSPQLAGRYLREIGSVTRTIKTPLSDKSKSKQVWKLPPKYDKHRRVEDAG